MEHGSVGERIAYWRKRRGYSQQVLAGLVERSASWMTKVERGDRIVDRLSVLLALANALKVDLGKLVGGVELPPNGGGPLDPPRGIVAVRRALFTVRPPDQEAPTAAELRAQVERAKRLRQAGSHEAVGIVLPGLITAGRAAVAQDVPGAWWCLAGAYQVTASLARTLGEVDLALLAADRAVAAAQRSGDGLLAAVSERLLACALMRQGLLDEAEAVCSDGADALAPTGATTPEGWSVWGSVQLTLAVAAVRGGDGASAWRVLRDARGAAERVGPGRNDYWEAFGPANVGAIEVTVALEAGDPVEALRIADTVEVDELPSAERRAVLHRGSPRACAAPGRHGDGRACARSGAARLRGGPPQRVGAGAGACVSGPGAPVAHAGFARARRAAGRRGLTPLVSVTPGALAGCMLGIRSGHGHDDMA